MRLQILVSIILTCILDLLLLLAANQDTTMLNFSMLLLGFLFIFPVIIIGNPFLQMKLKKNYVWFTPIYTILVPVLILLIFTGGISDLDMNLFLLQSDIKMKEKSTHVKKKVVNLLPSLDPYIMGYKERERYFLSNNHYHYIFDRTGNATSVILDDGQIIGIWDVINNKIPELEKEVKKILKVIKK